MGNHEYPCLVCGENKFGLGGCSEHNHSIPELEKAKERYRERGGHWLRNVKLLDEVISYKRKIIPVSKW